MHCNLEPVNLHSAAEFDELLRQRILCGWNNTPAVIEQWRSAIEAGTKAIFWIVLDLLSSRSKSQTDRFAGHIALQSVGDPVELDLANPDKSVLEISTFFILPEYRGGGLGRAAVEEVERYAKLEPYGSPSCRVVTVHTISRRYCEEEGEHWRGLYKRIGKEPPPKGSSAEDWYVRMGYVKWKEEPRYPGTFLDGEAFRWLAVYLRKELG